jgi:ABC-type bacteriocin/lantibiotic exporter with double-glycine peptidase domain
MIPYINVPVSQPNTHTVIPFYSQFADISSAEWRNKSCGIASLAMIINYFNPGAVTPQKLLTQGINSGAYITDAGWSHQGLANLASKYNLVGKVYDLSKLKTETAFSQFKDILKDGPAIASIHYKFEPTNPIPHLVVITAIVGDTVFYNDPASKEGDKQISADKFMKSWKKRFITVRPTKENNLLLTLRK